MAGEKKLNRICLDCSWMKHSRREWECGRCEFDNHKIDHINNHDWCQQWLAVEHQGFNDEDYNDEYIVVDIM